MCQEIFIKNNEGDIIKEIETINDFKKQFDLSAEDIVLEKFYLKYIGDTCLCPIDIEATLTKKGIKFKDVGIGYEVII
jgi:hypothetical protein